MKSTTLRLLTVVGLVAVVHLLFLAVQMHGRPEGDRSRPPTGDLTKLPKGLPPKAPLWRGEEKELDPRIFVGTGADVVVDRIYSDAIGHQISLHTSVTTKYSMALLHHPKHCHTVHGYELIDERTEELELPDQSNIRVGLLAMEREGQRIMVLYWYQFGDQIILDGGEQRKARWALRGQKTWPPLIKVLLTTPVDDPERTEERLLDFAKLVYAWTKDLDRQPQVD